MSSLNLSVRTFLLFSLLSSVVLAEHIVVNFEFEVTELSEADNPNFVMFDVGDRVTASVGYDSDAERTFDFLDSTFYPIDFIEVNFDDRFVQRTFHMAWMDVTPDAIVMSNVDTSDLRIDITLVGNGIVQGDSPPTDINVDAISSGVAYGQLVGKAEPNVSNMKFVSLSVVPEPSSACSFFVGFLLLFRFLILHQSFSPGDSSV